MRNLLVLLVALAFAGCTAADEPASTTTPTGEAADAPAAGLSGPVEVYKATLSFSVQTSGEQALDVPAAARTLTLDAPLRSDAPLSTAAEIRIAIEDAAGAVVLACEQGAAVGGSPPNCGPKTTGIGGFSAPYTLVWSGNGNVEADVTVTAE